MGVLRLFWVTYQHIDFILLAAPPTFNAYANEKGDQIIQGSSAI